MRHQQFGSSKIVSGFSENSKCAAFDAYAFRAARAAIGDEDIGREMFVSGLERSDIKNGAARNELLRENG
jgi:hypothetical protein